MTQNNFNSHLKILINRVLPDGGFAQQPGSIYCPDATAWAVMALDVAGEHTGLINPARSRLAAGQGPDGRVTTSKEHPDSFWPTSPAVLAWQGSIPHQEAMQKAVSFLLQSAGSVWEKRADSIFAHDPSVPGWSWNDNAFSWVEPTSLGILALASAGQGEHARVDDGVRLLMDRQLPRGGWNYGNTIVYDQELLPQPDNTGIALTALASRVDRKDVQSSLNYLHDKVQNLRSPRSLSWAIIGLGAWGQRPASAPDMILESLDLQDRFGNYDTTLDCLQDFQEEYFRNFQIALIFVILNNIMN